MDGGYEIVTHKSLKLAVFISGRGSNLKALIDACVDPDFPAEISLVLSNVENAGGLEYATQNNIPYEIVNHHKFDDKSGFEKEIQNVLKRYDVDLICLAGFMRLLSASFIDVWPDKIINIHPSLLPRYKGLDTHKRALADSAFETGCTVHFVRPEMDSGPIILQKSVPIFPDDTEKTLAVRVLVQEHRAYPQAVRMIAQNDIAISGKNDTINHHQD
jgi:phosphoribosylglycinamide formyltransferase-1